MSDNVNVEYHYDVNIGITLPDGQDAIYNAGLTPLFYTRNGYIQAEDIELIGQGEAGFAWSGTLSFHLSVSELDIRPSHSNPNFLIISLRCLVSTNNG